MKITSNPFRNGSKLADQAPYPSVETVRLGRHRSFCPDFEPTPLVDASAIAPVASLWVKDERPRMGLGSFKALGAAYVIACQANEASDKPGSDTPQHDQGGPADDDHHHAQALVAPPGEHTQHDG